MIAHILVALCMFLFVFLLRAFYQIFWKNGYLVKERNSSSYPVKVMIILGSGGHTTEILRIVAGMKSELYSPRIYVKANTDIISAMKVKEMEGAATDFELLDIRRSREVHQPYLTSVWTTIIAILDSIPIVWNHQPDLILCNGPGTCIPLCFVAFIYKLMFIMNIRIIFVESFCRVKTLSLTGKIMYYLADFVVVRWRHLNESLYRKTIYFQLLSIGMDISQLAKKLLPCETLLKDIENNSPPEIGIHLMSICKKLCASINSNGFLLSDQWIKNALVKLDACLDRTWESLNSGYWKDVSVEYRYCYSFCTILKSALLLIRFDNLAKCDKLKHMELNVLREVMLLIDKGILLGAPPLSIPGLLPNVAQELNSLLLGVRGKERWNIQDQLPLSEDVPKKELLPGFMPVPRCHQPSMEKFYTNIFQPKIPTILEGCMDHWRALNMWTDPEYLLQTAGVRTVPIEIGSRYTEENWTQRLVTLSEFLKSYVSSEKSSTPGYLAQHELFDQIPELMNDISIPDYCSFSDAQEEALPPNINAWLGPGGTISPLHFDPKNNLLCQVFGIKQIVLFHPDETPNLYPYETRLLSNTARVDPFNPDFDVWPRFKQAKGVTCVLGPGEMLFIPPGWWHHVVALSPSFSVSFWWD